MNAASATAAVVPRSRRFVRRLAVGILLLNILAIGMAGLTLQLSRERYRASAFVATQNLAQLLERDLTASFDKIDLVLVDIKEEAEQQYARGGLQPRVLDDLLAKKVFRLPELDALRITDANGGFVYGVGPTVPKGVNIADRSYFIRLRDDPKASLVISEPLVSRVHGQWSISVGRRLDRPDGSFAGIIYASIQLVRFQQIFAALDLGPNGAISLRDGELRLLARHPQGGKAVVGSRVVSEDLLAALAKAPEGGSYLAKTAMDGVERANTYRRIDKYPFYILVGIATQDYLADWRGEAVRTIAFTLAFSLISLLLAQRILKLWKQRDGDLLTLAQQESSLRESEQRFRLLVDGVKDYAIYMLSPEGKVLSWNRGAELLQQWRPDEIIGRHFSVFYPPEYVVIGLPQQHLLTAARVGRCEIEELRLRKDGTSFWAAVAITAIDDPTTGELRGFAKLIRNVTEQKRHELQEQAHSAVLDGIVAGMPLPTLLGVVIDGLERQLPGARCAILLRDVFGARLQPAAASKAIGDWVGVFTDLDVGSDGWCGAAITSKERVIVPELAAHPDCRHCRKLADAGLVSSWVEPIKGEKGDVLGVLVVCYARPATPEAFELGVLDQEAKLAGIAVERSRATDALKLAASVYQAIGEAIIVTGADNRIVSANPAFTQLTGYLPEEIVGKNPSVLGHGLHDQAYYQRMWHSLETTGRWQGQITNRHKDGSILTQWLMISTLYESDGKVAQRIGLYSEITDQKRAEEAVWLQANYDPLTLLPNRRLFLDRLDQEVRKAAREDAHLTLMFIDLDHFKEVNDSLGHDAGDLLLVEAARRISACVRETDTVARLGGDEFTVIIPGLDASARTTHVAEAIIAALAEPFVIGDDTAHIAGSAGIGVYPDDAQDRATLLKKTDRAMYAAKKAGRNRYCFYSAIGERAA
jgi:diguanylate cyclase (GGDEF)-like protein/PAS domain S-box-containing protein